LQIADDGHEIALVWVQQVQAGHGVLLRPRLGSVIADRLKAHHRTNGDAAGLEILGIHPRAHVRGLEGGRLFIDKQHQTNGAFGERAGGMERGHGLELAG